MSECSSTGTRTISGGADWIRYSPSTWWQSFASAPRLVLLFAFSIKRWRRRTSAFDSTASYIRTRPSTSIREYQTSRKGMPAKRSI